MHKLTNVDWEARRADCEICGPNTKIRVYSQGGYPKRVCAGPTSAWGKKVQRHEAKRRLQAGRGHGMPAYEAREWLLQFAGICQACGAEAELEPDHCHATNQLREGLCGPCNRTLGMAKDDPTRLRALVEYLGRHGIV